MNGLTTRQAQVLDYLKTATRRRGYPPTLREIAVHFGIKSTNGVNDHLRALERKGYIDRTSGASRGIRVLRDSNDRDSRDAPRADILQNWLVSVGHDEVEAEVVDYPLWVHGAWMYRVKLDNDLELQVTSDQLVERLSA